MTIQHFLFQYSTLHKYENIFFVGIHNYVLNTIDLIELYTRNNQELKELRIRLVARCSMASQSSMAILVVNPDLFLYNIREGK